MRLVILGLCAVAAWGCGPEDSWSPVPGERRSAIYLGTTYSGHPSVGELIYVGEQGICTATLIGKKTVLTAAHCIFPGSTHAFVAGGVTYQAASYKTHPSYNSTTFDSDVAVITLAQAPPIAPAAISTTAPWPGLKVTLIGYGSTQGTYENQSDDWGVKRITTATIWKVAPHELIWKGANGASCYGDSGGPALSTIDGKELQVGVTSHGPDPCGNEDHYTRVDPFVPWITQSAGGDVNTGQGMDSQPPVVTISAPTQGQSVASSLTVSASISDDTGVVSASLGVDGQPGASLTAPPYSFALGGLAPGSHSLRVTALDAAGNQGEATVTVSVAAATPPTPPEPDPAPAPSPSPTPTPGQSSPASPKEALYVGGCSSAPGATTASWPAALALLLLALVQRRRSS